MQNFRSILALLTLIVAPVAAQVRTGTLAIVVEEASSFNVGSGKILKIYKSTSNDAVQDPRLWQFQYEPPILVELNRNGTPNVRIVQRGEQWIVSLRFRLYSEDAQSAALRALRETYKDVIGDPEKIVDDNVKPLSVDRLTIELDAALGAVEEGALHLEKPEFRFGGTPDFCTIKAFAEDKAAADAFAEALQVHKMTFVWEYGIRRASRNDVKLTMRMLQNANLKARLLGDGAAATVLRDDVRTIVGDVAVEVTRYGYIEDPAQFRESVYDEFLENLTSGEWLDVSKVSEEVTRSTYDKADLEPDKIRKAFREAFTKQDGKYHLKSSGGAALGGSLKVGPISIGGNGSRSYSGDELIEMLRESGVKVEIQGDIVVPKQIDVRRVSAANWVNDYSFHESITRLSGEYVEPVRRDVDLWGETSGHEGLAEQVAKLRVELALLRADRLPPGVVIAWLERRELPNRNWIRLDGQPINADDMADALATVRKFLPFEAASLERTKASPNWAGDFLRLPRGDDRRALGELQMDALASHSHTMGLNGWDNTSGTPGTQRHPNFHESHGAGPKKATDSVGGDETRPRNRAVAWILKIR